MGSFLVFSLLSEGSFRCLGVVLPESVSQKVSVVKWFCIDLPIGIVVLSVVKGSC